MERMGDGNRTGFLADRERKAHVNSQRSLFMNTECNIPAHMHIRLLKKCSVCEIMTPVIITGLSLQDGGRVQFGHFWYRHLSRLMSHYWCSNIDVHINLMPLSGMHCFGRSKLCTSKWLRRASHLHRIRRFNTKNWKNQICLSKRLTDCHGLEVSRTQKRF